MLLDEMLNYNLYKKMYGGVILPELLSSKRLLEGNYLLKKYDDINDIMLKNEKQEREQNEIIEQIKRDYDRQRIYINGSRIKKEDVDNTISKGVDKIKNDQMNRININNIKYNVEVIEYHKLTVETRKRMIYLFKKCESTLIKNVPNFFSMTKFLGDSKPIFNTTIFLLYKITNKTKCLIGFLVMKNLIYNKKVTELAVKTYIKKNRKGGYLWWICGNDKYKGVSLPLFKKFNEYLLKNKYNYVLLAVEKEKNKLLELYKKFGYLKIGKATFFQKNDMIIMKKSFS